MGNLEELIERLCPDGVEYKTLGDVATISRGGNFQKKDFTEQGKPCIHYGQIYTRYVLFTDKTLTFINDECFAKQKYAEPNDIIMAVTSENIEDICKCVAWLGTEKVAVSGHSAIIHHSLDPKYLAYFFHSQHFFNQKRRLAHGTKVMEVTPDTLKSIQLPVPPLEVQREIVRILDNFAIATAEIQQKLQEELAARQKQYEYYRDLLLTFKPNESTILNERTNELELSGAIRWMKLGDIGSICMCKRILKSETNQNGGIPFYKIGTFGKQADAYISNEKFIEYKNRYKFPKKGDILISAAGTIGRTVVYDGKPAYFQDSNIVWIDNDETRVLNTFLNYWYSTSPWVASTGGTISRLYNDNIAKAPIPVPPLEVQQRIVDILDRFDTLCNDISSGLPAEIEMRQKQYEYYRDKLLTFKELKKEA